MSIAAEAWNQLQPRLRKGCLVAGLDARVTRTANGPKPSDGTGGGMAASVVCRAAVGRRGMAGDGAGGICKRASAHNADDSGGGP